MHRLDLSPLNCAVNHWTYLVRLVYHGLPWYGISWFGVVVVLKCGRRDPRSDSPRTGLVGGGHSEAQQVRKGMGGGEGEGGEHLGAEI